MDEPQSPIVVLKASADDEPAGHAEKTLEVHTRQVRLEDGEVDEETKILIRRWMTSL